MKQTKCRYCGRKVTFVVAMMGPPPKDCIGELRRRLELVPTTRQVRQAMEDRK